MRMEELAYADEPDHPELAATVSNLAGVYGNLGEVERQRDLLEQAQQRGRVGPRGVHVGESRTCARVEDQRGARGGSVPTYLANGGNRHSGSAQAGRG